MFLPVIWVGFEPKKKPSHIKLISTRFKSINMYINNENENKGQDYSKSLQFFELNLLSTIIYLRISIMLSRFDENIKIRKLIRGKFSES